MPLTSGESMPPSCWQRDAPHRPRYRDRTLERKGGRVGSSVDFGGQREDDKRSSGPIVCLQSRLGLCDTPVQRDTADTKYRAALRLVFVRHVAASQGAGLSLSPHSQISVDMVVGGEGWGLEGALEPCPRLRVKSGAPDLRPDFDPLITANHGS